MKDFEYPKKIFVKQICVANEKFNRTFEKVVKSAEREADFRYQATLMEPNFKHEFSDKPFAEK